MPKLEIYEPKPEPKPDEQPTRLRLVQEGSSARIIAVNENGARVNCGNILCISGSGKLQRHHSVNPDLGFDLETPGRVKIS